MSLHRLGSSWVFLGLRGSCRRVSARAAFVTSIARQVCEKQIAEGWEEKERRQIITQTQRAQRDRRAEGQEAEREKEEEGERKEDNPPKPDCPQSLLTCRRSRSTVSARLGSSWVFLGLRGSCRRVSAWAAFVLLSALTWNLSENKNASGYSGSFAGSRT